MRRKQNILAQLDRSFGKRKARAVHDVKHLASRISDDHNLFKRKKVEEIQIRKGNGPGSVYERLLHLNLNPVTNLSPKIQNNNDVKDFLIRTISSGSRLGVKHEKVLRTKLLKKVVMLDNPHKKTTIGALLKTLPRKQRKISSRKKREMCSMTMYPQLSFEDGLLLHSMWQQYIESTLQSAITPKQAASAIQHADLHGAMIQVVRSRVPQSVGLCGLVVKETANTFVILTRSLEKPLVTLVKASADFLLEAGPWIITLLGAKLDMRQTNCPNKKGRRKHAKTR